MKELPVLWYENEAGERWVNPIQGKLIGENADATPPLGFVYQRSRFPLSLHETILRIVSDEKGTRSERLGEGSSGWPGDLVLAMVRPDDVERRLQLSRYGDIAPVYELEQAILRAAGCEHCINTLAHRHGLEWGYRSDSDEDDSGTRCEGCAGTCPHRLLRETPGGARCRRCGELCE